MPRNEGRSLFGRTHSPSQSRSQSRSLFGRWKNKAERAEQSQSLNNQEDESHPFTVVDGQKPDLWLQARDILQKSQDAADWKMFQEEFHASGQFSIDLVLTQLQEKRTACEEQQWAYAIKDGKKIVLRDVMDKIVAWAGACKDVGASIAAFDPTNHAGLAWGAVQVLVTCAMNSRDTRDFILDQEPIARLITRYAIIEELYLSNISSETTGPALELRDAILQLYVKVLTYQAAVIKYLRQSHIVHALASLKPTHPAKEAMKNVESRMRTAEEYIPLVEHEGTSKGFKALKQKLGSLDDNLVRAANKIEYIKDVMDEDRREALLEWISDIPYMDHHQEKASSRMDNSGRWLLRSKIYKEWRAASYSSCLWLNGIAGAGKSTLVSVVIDDISARSTAANQERAAYFYCDKGSRAKELNDPSTVLKCILKQLSIFKDEPVMDLVAEQYKTKKRSGHLSRGECVESILKLTDRYPMTTIVIDALDEAPKKTRTELLTDLYKIMSQSLRLVKIFISSRRENDIKLRFMSFESEGISFNLEMGRDHNEEDIERFVYERIEEGLNTGYLYPGTEMSNACKRKLVSTLIAKAQGMFRWVELSIQALSEEVTESGMLKRVGQLPQELNDLYSSILESIMKRSEDDKIIFQRALTWILHSQQPLLADALLEAVSKHKNDGGSVWHKDSLLELCRNFIVLDQRDENFRFSHISVQEFLLTRDDFAIPQGHFLIAETCEEVLRRLVGPTASDNGTPGSLIYYAVNYFFLHCQLCCDHKWPIQSILSRFFFVGQGQSESNGGPRDGELGHQNVHDGEPNSDIYAKSMVFGDAQSKSSFVNWIEALRDFKRAMARREGYRQHNLLEEHLASTAKNHTPLRDAMSSPPNSLFAISIWGMAESLGDMSWIAADVIQQTNLEGKSVLCIACEYNHRDVAEKIIARMKVLGTPSETYSPRGYTALHSAAEHGSTDLVRLLLNEGFDVHAYTNERFPRTEKSEAGRGDIKSRNGHGPRKISIQDRMTALHLASRNGHLEVARLLIGAAADINNFTLVDRTALLIDSITVVNATVDLVYEGSMSALLWAAAGGHEELVDLLVTKGADVSRRPETAGDEAIIVKVGLVSANQASVNIQFLQGLRVTGPKRKNILRRLLESIESPESITSERPSRIAVEINDISAHTAALNLQADAKIDIGLFEVINAAVSAEFLEGTIQELKNKRGAVGIKCQRGTIGEISNQGSLDISHQKELAWDPPKIPEEEILHFQLLKHLGNGASGLQENAPQIKVGHLWNEGSLNIDFPEVIPNMTGVWEGISSSADTLWDVRSPRIVVDTTVSNVRADAGGDKEGKAEKVPGSDGGEDEQ